MRKTKSAILALTAILLLPLSAMAGYIDFTDLPPCCGDNDTSLTRTVLGTGPSVGAIATIDNPFSEQGIDRLTYDRSLLLGSGGLTLSWDLTFSETVLLTEITLGNPIIVNLGFNVVGAGINASGLLAGLGAGNYVLSAPLMLLANETYTFSTVNRNITPPVTSSGGQRFERWTFGEVTSVPEPGTLALFGIGLLGIGAARRRKKI